MNDKFEDVIMQDWIKSVLQSGIATVVFEKNDGTERSMKCTLSENIIPQSVPIVSNEIKKVRVVSKEVLPVYDIDVQGWRSFRWDSVKTVKVMLTNE